MRSEDVDDGENAGWDEGTVRVSAAGDEDRLYATILLLGSALLDDDDDAAADEDAMTTCDDEANVDVVGGLVVGWLVAA